MVGSWRRWGIEGIKVAAATAAVVAASMSVGSRV